MQPSAYCTSRSPWDVFFRRRIGLFHDVVNVCNDALNDDVRVFGLGFFEQFDQRFLGAVALLDQIGLLLCFQGGVVVAVVIVSVVMMVTIELFFAFTFVVLLIMLNMVMVMMALTMIRGWLLPD